MEEKDLKQIKEVVTEAVKAGNEEVAELVAKGFEGVDEKFEEVNQKFEEVNQKFEEVNQSIAEVKDSLQVIEAKVNKALNIEYVRLEKRLRVVEQKLGIKAAADFSE